MNVKKTCPRCGIAYSYIERRKVGDGVYYYAVHYYRSDGKRRVRKCYLGTLNYKCLQSLDHILDLVPYIEVETDELREIFEYVEKIYRKLKEILEKNKEETEKHDKFCFVVYGNIDMILFLLSKKIGKDRTDQLLVQSVHKLISEIKKEKLKELCKKADKVLESYGNIGGYCVSQPHSSRLENILSELHEKMVYVTPGELISAAMLLNIEKFAIPENRDLVNQLVQVRKKLFES